MSRRQWGSSYDDETTHRDRIVGRHRPHCRHRHIYMACGMPPERHQPFRPLNGSSPSRFHRNPDHKEAMIRTFYRIN